MSDDEKKDLHDTFGFAEKVVIRVIPKEKGRYPYEQHVCENWPQADGTRKNNTRVIDRKNDIYKEITSDSEGNITHKCEENLSDHIGHGSAKSKKGNGNK